MSARKPKRTIHLTTLGCAKNTVDTDSMAQLLIQDGYRLVRDPRRAGVLVVNTCGFIEQAREQSYKALRSLAAIKRPGQVLIAAGCLTQRYGEEVARRVPGIDGILGTRRWMDILEVVKGLRAGPHPAPLYHLPEVPAIGKDEHGVLRASIEGASAYLKIADGCHRPCAFCAIPLIKGPTVSRPLQTIVDEAHSLVLQGVRELILIAQDTTSYGADLGMRDGLSTLIERLVAEVPPSSPGSPQGLDWIRIMYAFPGSVSDRLVGLMASHPQILPYLDIPLQHAHPDTLRRMGRPANMEWVHRTISRMRNAVPGLAIRTVFIVGYPGETEKEFQALLDFVREMRFDRVGAFQFSFEAGTASASLGDPIPPALKEDRFQRLMTLQQDISLQVNQSYVGRTLQVLIEHQDRSRSNSKGRSYRDAPEVDGEVVVEGLLPVNTFHSVRIVGALTYDLSAVPVPS